MTTDTTYNGWKNYETWNIKLWLDNDQGLEEMQQDMARHNRDPHDLAEALKDFVTDPENGIIPELPNGPAADLLGAALDAVDWYEIAENILADLDPEDED